MREVGPQLHFGLVRNEKKRAIIRSQEKRAREEIPGVRHAPLVGGRPFVVKRVVGREDSERGVYLQRGGKIQVPKTLGRGGVLEKEGTEYCR